MYVIESRLIRRSEPWKIAEKGPIASSQMDFFGGSVGRAYSRAAIYCEPQSQCVLPKTLAKITSLIFQINAIVIATGSRIKNRTNHIPPRSSSA